MTCFIPSSYGVPYPDSSDFEVQLSEFQAKVFRYYKNNKLELERFSSDNKQLIEMLLGEFIEQFIKNKGLDL